MGACFHFLICISAHTYVCLSIVWLPSVGNQVGLSFWADVSPTSAKAAGYESPDETSRYEDPLDFPREVDESYGSSDHKV